MGCSPDGATLDIEGSIISSNIYGEVCLEKLLRLMPVNLGVEIYSSRITVEINCLVNRAKA